VNLLLFVSVVCLNVRDGFVDRNQGDTATCSCYTTSCGCGGAIRQPRFAMEYQYALALQLTTTHNDTKSALLPNNHASYLDNF
jgi:hypothetical protein